MNGPYRMNREASNAGIVCIVGIWNTRMIYAAVKRKNTTPISTFHAHLHSVGEEYCKSLDGGFRNVLKSFAFQQTSICIGYDLVFVPLTNFTP